MSYDDFWFIDTRVQTRNLRRWLIWFILLFAFVTVGSIMAVKTMYKDINAYGVRSGNNLNLTVNEAKATNVNGYIKGTIKNVGENELDGGYICAMLFDENYELKGTEYLDVGTIRPDETKNYELKFKRDNIKHFYLLTVSDEIL